MSRKLNILVVDDDAANAEFLAELFAMDNHRVIVADDGEQAIEAFSLNKVDVGFFDATTPKKNGVDSFMQIKSTNPEARVYFMTGYSADDLIDTAVKGGALGVFQQAVILVACWKQWNAKQPDRCRALGRTQMANDPNGGKRLEDPQVLLSILDNLPTSIFVKDEELNFVYSNVLHCEMIGRSEAELLGHSDADFSAARGRQGLPRA